MALHTYFRKQTNVNIAETNLTHTSGSAGLASSAFMASSPVRVLTFRTSLVGAVLSVL